MGTNNIDNGLAEGRPQVLKQLLNDLYNRFNSKFIKEIEDEVNRDLKGYAIEERTQELKEKLRRDNREYVIRDKRRKLRKDVTDFFVYLELVQYSENLGRRPSIINTLNNIDTIEEIGDRIGSVIIDVETPEMHILNNMLSDDILEYYNENIKPVEEANRRMEQLAEENKGDKGICNYLYGTRISIERQAKMNGEDSIDKYKKLCEECLTEISKSETKLDILNETDENLEAVELPNEETKQYTPIEKIGNLRKYLNELYDEYKSMKINPEPYYRNEEIKQRNKYMLRIPGYFETDDKERLDRINSYMRDKAEYNVDERIKKMKENVVTLFVLLNLMNISDDLGRRASIAISLSKIKRLEDLDEMFGINSLRTNAITGESDIAGDDMRMLNSVTNPDLEKNI